MNMQGFIILITPIVGLIPICKDRSWNWRVTNSGPLTILFWIGWFTSIVVGISVVIGRG